MTFTVEFSFVRSEFTIYRDVERPSERSLFWARRDKLPPAWRCELQTVAEIEAAAAKYAKDVAQLGICGRVFAQIKYGPRPAGFRTLACYKPGLLVNRELGIANARRP